jgi:hypothetical protein
MQIIIDVFDVNYPHSMFDMFMAINWTFLLKITYFIWLQQYLSHLELDFI